MFTWHRKFSKSESFKDPFKNYKIPDSKGKLPNRAEFTGDKHPSSGNSAKVELNAYRQGVSTYKGDKKVEEKAKVPSPILFEKNRRQFLGIERAERKNSKKSTITRKWRTILSDLNFQKDPDGSVEIKVTDIDTQAKTPAPPPGVEQVEENYTESKKRTWPSVFGSEADIDFKKDVDGTMIFKIKHVNEPENKLQPSQPAQLNTPPEVATPSSSQETVQSPTQSPVIASTPCGGHEDMKEYILRKDGYLRLVARECKDKVGIFIEQLPRGVLANSNATPRVLASETQNRDNHEWRELINTPVWEAKYEQILKK